MPLDPQAVPGSDAAANGRLICDIYPSPEPVGGACSMIAGPRRAARVLYWGTASLLVPIKGQQWSSVALRAATGA